MFDAHLKRWHLIPDGEPIITHCSRLLPVRYQGAPAILKIAMEAEEKLGGLLMVWWNGDGAAPVLKHEGDALLLERAMGKASLVEMAKHGQDDEATRIMCQVADKLHKNRNTPPPNLLPLAEWFKELAPAAEKHGGILKIAAATAHELLQNPQDVTVLHGDIHHGNILDFEAHGWLAIDPKRLQGERGFDYANIFCNPDFAVATATGRLHRQVGIVAEAAKLDRVRLLKWILAYAGLSAAWTLGDGDEPDIALAVAELAAKELS